MSLIVMVTVEVADLIFVPSAWVTMRP
jgi:hypothetical protein